MKLKISILFLCIISILSSASPKNDHMFLDSMVAQIKTIEIDSVKWVILENVNDSIKKVDIDMALFYWEELGNYCIETDYYRGAGFCFRHYARLVRRQGEYYKSYLAYQKSLENIKLSGDIWTMAAVYNGLGSLFSDLNQTAKSSENYKKSIDLFHSINDTVWEGSVNLNLGGMYEEQDSFQKAKLYLKKSEELLSEINHHNLLNCYINLGIVFDKSEIFDSAQYYFEESYKRSLTVDDVRDKFNGLYYLGRFYFEQGNYEKADTFLIKAKMIAENPVKSGDLSVVDLRDFTNVLGYYFHHKQNFEKAYYYLRKSFNYDTEIKLDEINKELIRIEIERLESEALKKQKRKDNFIVVTLIGLLIVIIVLFSVYRSYRHKQKANRLLTEMDELKTRLYSNITHELRTPLTLILGPLEQMLSPDNETTPTYKQIKLMRKNANSLLNLVNQMLDLSKIDAQGLKLELIEQDIVSFIKAHFVAFSSLAERKKIEFNYYLPAERKIRMFDADKLEKVINNLLSNAIKYTSKNGKVFCFASFPKLNKLELIVQDTGDGIAPEQINKIFDRFHQVPGSNVSQLGTGIGLSLTKELVDLMHGEIKVESIVGEGTKFKILLPLGKEHLNSDDYTILDESNLTPINIDHSIVTETEEKENRTKPAANDLPSILIVEDHLEISQFIQDNLVDRYSVNKAENGKIGFECAVETIPDLIISDVMMPEMNGIEMTGKLKTDERTSHIPIILLTAQTSHKQKLKGLETGIDAFVPKPFNMKELELRIKKLIEQRQRLREKYTSNLKLEPKDVAVTSADEKFLNRVMEIVEKNIGNPDFETKDFQDELLLSRMQLFRKIKALTNQTPGEFIRTIRLKRAASLIEQKYGNIAQITYEVGFNNPSYFAKCFKELYGVLPSEFKKGDK